MVENFRILIWVMATHMYVFVKTHQVACLKSVHFTLCKLFLNKVLLAFKNVKNLPYD